MTYTTLIVVIVSAMLNICICYPLSQFYSYGLAAGDSELPANDDNYTSSIPISVSFPFFGSSYTSIYVNNNGDVTFETPLRQYTSQPFPINGSHRIIAPFWTDIDTRYGGKLWYRTTTDRTILQRGTNKINTLFPDIVPFNATWMMVITWKDVAAYRCSTSGTISCQQVGFNAGDGEHYYSVNGSRTDAVLNLPQMSNINISGQFVFRVDQAKITNADTVDECASSPCVHGNCSIEYLHYECICDPGYTGVNCENEIDECQSSPCIHGNCSDHLNHYTCQCQDGFTGTNCQTDMVDECVSSPCVHGNCSNEYLHYECFCFGGYTGVNCETEIDECQSSPCIHGNCSDHLNHYTCQCQDGFTGTNCQADINECASFPCVHGNCTDRINGYTCNCTPGYSGTHCEEDINECQSSPCVHGNCSDLINHYTCQCYAGYTGTNCEIDIDECASSPCIHGNCTDQVNGYTCQCIPGYTGVQCETEIDECSCSPCMHGSCIDEINNYICVCDTAYYGRDCSQFNVSYLIPLLIGLLLLVLALVLLFLWKRMKRDSESETFGVIYFSDTPLGPSKTSFGKQTQNSSTFPTFMGYLNLLWRRITELTKSSGKINAISSNTPENIQRMKDSSAFQTSKIHQKRVDMPKILSVCEIDEIKQYILNKPKLISMKFGIVRIFFMINAICQFVNCYPLNQFYPFGLAAGDRELPSTDDGYTSNITTSVPFPFFGSSFCSLFVNNNGDVTFQTPLSQYSSEPFPINGSHRIIAPFWCDIDTSKGGHLWYRTTSDSATLQQGTNKVRSLFPDLATFSASWMLVATWEDVSSYRCDASGPIYCNQGNTFQLLLITDGVHSFAVFNYNKINWSVSAQVGFNAGDGTNFYSVTGSRTDAVLNLPQMSNIGIPGEYVFRVDQNKISNADTVDECASSPCVHGNCSNEYLYYECFCDPGYSGVNCENDTDECQSSPCIHGNCSDHLNHFTCHCQDGYTGRICETDIDECSSSPCIFGTCTDHVNSYVCDCLSGYSGKNCETDVDECQSSPCTNGNCSDHVNRYTCQCYAGYAGINCEIDINECTSSPCIHGNCTDQVNGYICQCIRGYTGVICETDIDECTSSPCEHGACTDGLNSYICDCDTGYYGRQCSNCKIYLSPFLIGLSLWFLALLALLIIKRFKR
ncbi:uncharacterized protein LOC134274009 [Saccostrea cucullata]|uniref:uncharacterized protein LOC134274009 n=1 Tax=Saccostrea cuccullata TaxID=36930 RepID=UPI002ED60771